MKTRSTINDAKAKVVKNEGGVLTIRVLGVGFGSKDHRDLDGEFFTPDTNFSDEIYALKGVNYDHLPPSWMANPYGSHTLKTEILGTAKLVETTDEGRWYEMEIMKAEEYHDYFIKLAKSGHLGASTQAMPGGVTRLPSGEIVSWPETAVALTVQPANPDTIGTINAVAKSTNIPLFSAIQKSLEDVATETALAEADKAEKDAAAAAAAAAAADIDADADADDDKDAPKGDSGGELTDKVVNELAQATAKAIADQLAGPLAAVADIVKSLMSTVSVIETLTENEEFKSFVSDFAETMEENNRNLKAATFVIAKTASPKIVKMPGQSKKDDQDGDASANGTPKPAAKRSFLPDTFDSK